MNYPSEAVIHGDQPSDGTVAESSYSFETDQQAEPFRMLLLSGGDERKKREFVKNLYLFVREYLPERVANIPEFLKTVNNRSQ